MEDTEKPSPFLVVVAGPNGSGKTTATDLLRSQGLDLGEYINPDEITQELLKNQSSPTPQDFFTANKTAQTIADQRRQAALNDGRSLSFESVMSHPSKVDFMREAKERGYDVRFYFVGTDDPLINLERVKDRVQKGGHDVPQEKTLSRYERVMDLLPEAIKQSDLAQVYDNSSDNDPTRLITAIKEGKTVIYLNNPPHWVTERLLNKLDPKQIKASGGIDKDHIEKAKTFLTSEKKDLLKKYPGDQAILDALAIREVAGKFVGQNFTDQVDQQRFMETTNSRLAHNIAHNKPNRSPLIKETQQQEQKPPKLER